MNSTVLSPSVDPGRLPRLLRRSVLRRAQLVDDPRYCRLVNDDGDDLPGLVIDRYDAHFVIQSTSAEVDAQAPELARALEEIAGARSVLLRNDTPRRAWAGLPIQRPHVLLGAPPRWTRLLELGARMTLDLHHGGETGYTYALHEVRRTVGRLAQNARVLDPACFVGGSVVQAGLHGARQLLAFTGDPDEADLAQENVEANGLMRKVKVACADPLETLGSMDDHFDLVLLHAPIRWGEESGLRDLDALIGHAVRVTRRGGRLVLAAAGWALGDESLELRLERACAAQGRKATRLLTPGSPADFPWPVGRPEVMSSVVVELA